MTRTHTITFAILLALTACAPEHSSGFGSETGTETGGADTEDECASLDVDCTLGDPDCPCDRTSVPYAACTYSASVCVGGTCTYCEPGTEGCACAATVCAPGLECVAGECAG